MSGRRVVILRLIAVIHGGGRSMEEMSRRRRSSESGRHGRLCSRMFCLMLDLTREKPGCGGRKTRADLIQG